jgi:hypothetical protein
MLMKKIVLVVYAFCISVFSTQGQSAVDKKAIQKMIAAESDFFYKKDFKGWSSCYMNSPQTYWSCIEKGDVVLEAQGWSNIAKFVGDYIKANPDPEKVSIARSRFQYRPYGNNAVWVTFDEVLTTSSEVKKLRSIRLVERTKAGWKIVYMNSYPQSGQ